MDKAFGFILLLGFAGVESTELPDILSDLAKTVKGVDEFVQIGTHLAGTLGTKDSGEIPFGEDGRTISWSFKGKMIGFQWKYMGICTDSKTGHTETVFMESRGGALDHCLTNLIGRLKREEL
ncbi:uncharacterized protein LOC128236546 [Mya arenaria]|uniref:uncharacterized protein LOC128236546 n=1 Tax=Mya arenaria TaxID=6604 RepID=UPI0022E40EBE|nr:uncharacterized protein LOC128236546 [Mya arenaria]